jgi:plastocyanin
MLPRLLFIVAALGATLVPSAHSPRAAVSGTIRGRVDVRGAAADGGGRLAVTDLTMASTRPPIDRRSVVYLDPAPRAAFDTREEPRPRLDQRNETFVPHVLAIVAGTSVDFPNNDRTYHNVFSLSKTKTFDLGRYAAGHSKAVRFDKPGIVRVFCDIHSHMSAFILVFAHHYFSVADADGVYRLPNVPPGAYTVVAWSESAPLESRQVVVPDSGGDVEVNFSLGRR